MSGMTIEADVVSVRPSRLVAEALVNGHNLAQVERRAKALGIPREVARVVAAVGCRCSNIESMSTSLLNSGDNPARS
jgi:hypothetical protein